ncbi:MAG: anthranilate synthase component I [Armatimonadetes bacterium]|nr:anthranilate synthase component I [Armatimonadota bacterium]
MPEEAPRPNAAVPVWREVLADFDTPLSAYWKLAHDEPVSFLLESVTGGEQLARYSFIGVRPKAMIRGGAERLAEVRNLPRLDPESWEGLPKFVGGAVGMIAYDFVRSLERLPEPPADDLGLDDVAFMVVETVVAFDHVKNRIVVVSLCDGTAQGRSQAETEIERIVDRLSGPLPDLPKGASGPGPVLANRTQGDYEAAVSKIIGYVAAGDCIQVVPSVRFATKVDAHAVNVYRALRSVNPSPYMYLLRFGDFDVVGASPELLVSLVGREARVRPIAGTRARGATQVEDDALASELLADEKERAEHIMLVDLGRNDLGRVSETGSVHVRDLMVVERYSHVMHIVSSVEGRLAEGLDGVDLVRATFPAGTVSGAQKVRAMQIIDELEPTRRGLYAGAVGYFSVNGDVDLAIAIRTVLIKDGTAYVQAGAGIVFDSDPGSEWRECVRKAQASLRAIEIAQSGLRGF